MGKLWEGEERLEHRPHTPNFNVSTNGDDSGNKLVGQPAPDVAQPELCEEKQMGGPVNCSDSELCTFLQALAAGYLPICYLDTSPSVPLKSITIASKSWQHGRKTGAFPGFQFSMMLQNSEGSGGAGLLILSQAGSRAKTLVQPAQALELMESAADYGPKWHGLFAKYDHLESKWRTAQCSLLGDSDEFLETWPRWGSMLNGASYQRQMLEPTMSEKESGSLLATPTATSNQLAPSMMKHPGCREIRKMLPTPTCHNAKEGAYPSEHERNTPTLATHVGGKIPPIFTEWMMGWPIGWTDLKPLETARFREWRQQHGGF